MAAAGDCIDDAFDFVNRQRLQDSTSTLSAILAGARAVLDSSIFLLKAGEDSETFRYRTMKVKKALEMGLYSEFVRLWN
jgi:hypothetical protein